MNKLANHYLNTVTEILFKFHCEDQYRLAEKLAQNCGYVLKPEDDERSLKIKQILNRIENNSAVINDEGDRDLIAQCLKALL